MELLPWTTDKLKNLPIAVIDGDRSSRYPKRSELVSRGVMFLSTPSIVAGRIDFSLVNFITEEKFSEIKKGRIEAGDVILTTRGSIGKLAFFQPQGSYQRGIINAQMLILRADRETIDPRFLFYLMSSERYQQEMRNFSSGSAQPQIPITDLKETTLSFPIISVQQEIAQVLASYDNLIENNNRRIAILEEIAQSLYREWFVKFRFPGHEDCQMVDSPLGPIPEGWQRMKVKEILKRLKAGTAYKQADVDTEGSVVVVDQSRHEVLGYHSNEADHLATNQKPIAIFGDHTCKMQLMVREFSVGPNVIPFESKTEHPLQYIFFLIRSLVSTQEYKRHWTELNQKEVLVAPSILAERYADFVSPILAQTNVLRTTCMNLREQRDLLLPKLISGQFDLGDAGQSAA